MAAVASLPMAFARIAYEGQALTQIERDVLKRLALGDTHRQIAQRTGRSHETIRKHTKKARAKLGARNNTQAVAIAISLDMI